MGNGGWKWRSPAGIKPYEMQYSVSFVSRVWFGRVDLNVWASAGGVLLVMFPAVAPLPRKEKSVTRLQVD